MKRCSLIVAMEVDRNLYAAYRDANRRRRCLTATVYDVNEPEPRCR